MKQGKNKLHSRLMNLPIWIHLIAVIAITSLLIIGLLQALKVYTRHNAAVIVPDVKGLQVEDAATFFANNGLHYSVIDSVYSKTASPGAIVELVPSAGSKVKDGRIIFLTVNAKTTQQGVLPDVSNLSYRQALAMIQSKGFTSVGIKSIPGEYKDLTTGVELNGKKVNPGTMLPLSSKLFLIVVDGSTGENSQSDDSPQTGEQASDATEETTIKDTENWF